MKNEVVYQIYFLTKFPVNCFPVELNAFWIQILRYLDLTGRSRPSTRVTVRSSTSHCRISHILDYVVQARFFQRSTIMYMHPSPTGRKSRFVRVLLHICWGQISQEIMSFLELNLANLGGGFRQHGKRPSLINGL